ncbi:hypothetical protein QJS10_CPB18g00795 [Acorus calamus]|uniref:Uncharacterized protein n=1 Tax=Acorus calamus TaxID=4465 RepID=A0AAV9CQ25_ACOCL|nr:hypothetical protein QJS10_CPB18g00795 [Acorus calamus]
MRCRSFEEDNHILLPRVPTRGNLLEECYSGIACPTRHDNLVIRPTPFQERPRPANQTSPSIPKAAVESIPKANIPDLGSNPAQTTERGGPLTLCGKAKARAALLRRIGRDVP